MTLANGCFYVCALMVVAVTILVLLSVWEVIDIKDAGWKAIITCVVVAVASSILGGLSKWFIG